MCICFVFFVEILNILNSCFSLVMLHLQCAFLCLSFSLLLSPLTLCFDMQFVLHVMHLPCMISSGVLCFQNVHLCSDTYSTTWLCITLLERVSLHTVYTVCSGYSFYSKYFPVLCTPGANLYQRALAIWYSLCVHYKCKWKSKSVRVKEREIETERDGESENMTEEVVT